MVYIIYTIYYLCYCAVNISQNQRHRWQELPTLLCLCEEAPSPSQHFHWGLLCFSRVSWECVTHCQWRGEVGQKGRGICLHSEQELWAPSAALS